MFLEEIDKQYLLQTYSKKYINFIRGHNATLYDDEGNNYIDFSSGIGVVSIGHGNKKLASTLYEQAKNIIHVSNLYAIKPQSFLAEKIVHLSKYDMACFFGNSGAEANEGAIKIARKYGQEKYHGHRYNIVTLKDSFHGRTLATMKATGQSKIHKHDFSPYPDGFIHATNIDDIYACIDESTVAVMIELIQGEGGLQELDKTKVQTLAHYLKTKDILLIIDEIQTGVYRTGEFLASHLYGIQPDVITLAKGLAGGVPIGVVMTKLKNIFAFGDHGSTFGGNFLSTSAALTVCENLETLKNEGTLNKSIHYFDIHLENIYQKYKDIFLGTVGLGLMKGLKVKSESDFENIIHAAFEHKILILKSGKNTLRFLPPLTISNDEIEEGFMRFENILKELV